MVEKEKKKDKEPAGALLAAAGQEPEEPEASISEVRAVAHSVG